MLLQCCFLAVAAAAGPAATSIKMQASKLQPLAI